MSKAMHVAKSAGYATRFSVGPPGNQLRHTTTVKTAIQVAPKTSFWAKLNEIVRKLGTGTSLKTDDRKTRTRSSLPTKRDTILFAAIVRDLELMLFTVERLTGAVKLDAPNR